MTAPNQGTPQEAPPAPGQAGVNGPAVAGLVLAIFGLIGGLIFVVPYVPMIGLALCIGGLVLGIMGTKKAPEVGGTGKGAATAAVIVGIIGIVISGGTSACQVACGAAATKIGAEMDRAANEAGYEDMGAFGKAMEEAAKEMEKELEKMEKATPEE